QATDAALLVDVLLREAELDGLTEQVVVVVDVHDEVSAVLDGEFDVVVVSERGVLDGIKSGEDGAADALGAMSMGGDLASGVMSFFGGDLQLVESKAGRAGIVALGENASGSADLDQVDVVLDLGTNDVAHLVDAVGEGESALLGKPVVGDLGRVVVE